MAENSFRKGNLVGLAHDGLGDQSGTQAASTHGNGAYFAIGELVAHVLQVRVEHALGLDVGVAHIVSALRLLAADFALLGHGISSVYSDGRPKNLLVETDCPHQRVVLYMLSAQMASTSGGVFYEKVFLILEKEKNS